MGIQPSAGLDLENVPPVIKSCKTNGILLTGAPTYLEVSCRSLPIKAALNQMCRLIIAKHANPRQGTLGILAALPRLWVHMARPQVSCSVED
ncbi:hypothetical protein Rhe02_65540 [Rhizocola hellebori]|uniref:Uncharacterized protein n=1 Tax=Rhizocola hellebori TaxID=1392758 RepID=A0A8J3VJI4_9ACTN|nr:hypothetical protein Rhe02_65540 [Rhizocola hellebori]